MEPPSLVPGSGKGRARKFSETMGVEISTERPTKRVGGTGNGRKRVKTMHDDASSLPLQLSSSAPLRKRRKLLEGVRVEVRFSEEGLKGSWHPGLVIGCENCLRHVEYNEILADDNTSKLVEAIPVSKATEGLATRARREHRTSIRPEPPHRSVDQSSVSYGACVDALVDDAWWEGVVFDREDGRPERWVLFPDQGDRQLIPIEKMRHTLDWNEVSGDWKPRGDWIMLRVLDKLEKEEPFPISVREIWYDVSCSDTFREKIGQWVFGSWSTWRALATSAIKEALDVAQGGIAAQQIVPLTKLPIEAPLAIENAVFSVDDIDSLEGVQIQRDAPDSPIGPRSEVTIPREQNHSVSDLVGSPYRIQGSELCKIDDSSGTYEVVMNPLPQLAEEESILKEGRDSAILAFLSERHNHSGPRSPSTRKRIKELRGAAKSELISSGWMEKEWECGSKYYVSNKGHRSLSLVKACELWAKLKSSDDIITQETVLGHDSSQTNETENGDNDACGSGRETKNWELVNIEGDHSTFAIVNYAKYLKESKSQSEKSGQNGFYNEAAKKTVKKHLVALGWSIYQQKMEFAGRIISKHLYSAPDGSKFQTLDKAVMYLISTGQYAGDKEKDFREIVQESARRGYQKSDPTEIGTIRSADLVPENCPGAIEDYVDHMELNKNKWDCNLDVKQKRSRVKKHLLHMGWKAWYTDKYNRVEIRYTSPDNKVFASLLQACKYFLREQYRAKGTSPQDGTNESEKKLCLSNGHSLKLGIRVPRSLPSTKAIKAKKTLGGAFGKDSMSSPVIVGSKEVSVQSKRLGSRTDDSVSPGYHDVTEGPSSSCCESYKNRKGKTSCTRVTHRSGSSTAVPKRTLRSKNGEQVHESHQHAPRTILSWLIDKNAVSLRQKVQYLRKRDGHIMKEGQITREGIRCKCCKQVFTLSQFELHAGSMNHRPSANIFLLDGRSILDCQRQILSANDPTISTGEHVESDDSHHSCGSDSRPHKRIKSLSRSNNDGVCSICQYGGTLILCDYCPSSYHLSCIGLEDVPEGEWFCPPCRCGLCGLGDFNCDSSRFTKETKLFCDQCEREYHVGCLEKCGSCTLTSCPEGYWFCNDTCSKIFSHLRQLLGKSNPTAVEGYSWTILKSNDNDFDDKALSKETKTEHHSKLCVAQDVLHECFVTMIEPRTNTDLVVDLLFNRESDLNRLNFRGFYTLLLERDEELITVATIRILGNKVAEMPLIGTRIKHRRKGMCRLLINELEKLLCPLGVERLLLPAIPELLETWTTKFGFSEMSDSEKLLFVDRTFLNFQGTTICQKLINPSTTTSGYVLVIEKTERVSGDSLGIIVDGNSSSNTSNSDINDADVEMVPSLNVSPPNTWLLSSEVVLVRDNESSISKVHNSSMISLQSANLLQDEEQQNLGKQVSDAMTMSVAPGTLEDNSTTTEITILTTKATTGLNCQRQLQEHCDQTVSSSFGSKWCLMNALNVKSFNTFKYYYKRRLLA